MKWELPFFFLFLGVNYKNLTSEFEAPFCCQEEEDDKKTNGLAKWYSIIFLYALRNG